MENHQHALGKEGISRCLRSGIQLQLLAAAPLFSAPERLEAFPTLLPQSIKHMHIERAFSSTPRLSAGLRIN